jgi:hypothetical protein
MTATQFVRWSERRVVPGEFAWWFPEKIHLSDSTANQNMRDHAGAAVRRMRRRTESEFFSARTSDAELDLTNTLPSGNLKTRCFRRRTNAAP